MRRRRRSRTLWLVAVLLAALVALLLVLRREAPDDTAGVAPPEVEAPAPKAETALPEIPVKTPAPVAAVRQMGPVDPAAPPGWLGLPLICPPGVACTVQNYVDLDPGEGAVEFGCGPLTYDGHTGTDFQVPDQATADAGVEVTAAAAGTVRAVRDELPDTGMVPETAEQRDGKALGNAVVLDHGGGWTTAYGHLRQGSVAVGEGEAVAAGQALGLIGLSGNTEFPHVHFELRFENRVIDPFVGLDSPSGCGDERQPLWRTGLDYVPTGALCAGWATDEPDRAAVKARCADQGAPSAEAPALVTFAEVYGVRAGDLLRLRIAAPDGSVLVDDTRDIAGNRARQFAFAGKRRPEAGWPAGRYEARIELARRTNGGRETIVDLARSIDIP